MDLDPEKLAALQLLFPDASPEKLAKIAKMAKGEPQRKRRHPKLPKDAIIHLGFDPWGVSYSAENPPGRQGSIMSSVFNQFKAGMTVADALGLGHADSRIQKFAKEGWIWISAADGSVLLQLTDETGSVVQDEPDSESSLINGPTQIGLPLDEEPEEVDEDTSETDDGETLTVAKSRSRRKK